MSILFEDSQSYWNNKLSTYLHDPFDKAFMIQGHEERARVLLEALGVQKPNDEFWRKADGIAAGLERGQLPSHSKDQSKNGAVDFLKDPVISHPTGGSNEKSSNTTQLRIKLPEQILSVKNSEDAEELTREIAEYIHTLLGRQPGDTGYSNQDIFRSKLGTSEGADLFAQARFLYTHLVLRFKLAQDDVIGLGGLWHRLPADTRFPDHSIWQHNALTSALYSAGEIAGSVQENVGLMVFSLTPVQSFIAKARKLRDYWTGSILLSWLAFEGILWIVENLGPDHIVYPSLIDQPLMNRYLEQEWDIQAGLNTDSDIASFPNKFVAVVPLNKLDEIKLGVSTRINDKWKEITEIGRDFLLNKSDPHKVDPEHLKTLFSRQTENYWEINFAAVKLLGSGDTEELGKLFNPKIYEDNQKAAEIFDTILKKTGKNYTSKQEGVFYEVTHRATQAALAAKKMQRSIRRKPEPGEKCSQCGEFEVLHARAHGSGESVEKYRESINDFWDRFRSSGEFVSDFSDKERLCSVCALKRIIYRALKADRAGQHILRDSFLEKENYPSTTFLALYDFFRRNNISDVEEKKKISQELFEGDTDSLQGYQEQPGERDKYYAILLMDGDRMGKLVNGETISANRKSIMHPQIIERLQNESFFAPYHEGWEQLFELRGGRRFLSPAVHAAISESLGDFSLYGVKPIIHKYSGTLIYAGGDDVCAVLPVSRVLPAAREIAAYYTSTFRLIKKENGSYSSEVIEREWTPEPDKLSVNLGTGKDISISAGILVCHHKEALKDMIFRAHALLDKKAKKEGDRNACAIELRKRSGGSRYFVRKFDAVEKWEAFETISKAVERGSEDIAERVSGSLIYRLESFREGFEAILHSRTLSQSEREGRTIDLLKAQLKRSVPELVERGEDLDKISKSIHHLIMEGDEFKPEALIVSAFFGKEVS